MGQYYVIANLDKKEFINPTSFGDGSKLLEFGSSSDGTMTGLVVLLASSNGRGGGDLHLRSDRWSHIPGRWAGDRVVVAGDYDDDRSSPGYGVYRATSEKRFKPETGMSMLSDKLKGTDTDEWKDITWDVIGALMEDHSVGDSLAQRIAGAARWDRDAKDLWNYVRPAQELPKVK